jgi:hypothetical protein
MNNLAICLYGTSIDNVSIIKHYCEDALKYLLDSYNITYFENVEDADIYLSLWKVAFKKRQEELIKKNDFDICLAIDTSDDNVNRFSNFEPLLSNIHYYNDKKIYFSTGTFFPERGSTSVSPQIFFSNSLMFDLACNFGLKRHTLPSNRKLGTIGEDFYYFLKTLKIKTECINYENSDLFKRTA